MNNKRMTRKEAQDGCRIDKCFAEYWMYELYSNNYPDYPVCKNCPFKKYINRLAELEDKE